VTDQPRTTPSSGRTPDDKARAPFSTNARQQIADFIEGARWFGGKGRGLTVTGVRRLGVIAESAPRVVVDVCELTYADGVVEQYQLPLALYTEPEHRLDHAFVGWWDDPDIGWTHAYDAVHDREAMAAYRSAFAEPDAQSEAGWASSSASGSASGSIVFHRLPGEPIDPEAVSSAFTGEQSNSSVAFGEEALLKMFRRVTPGTNPDIEVHEALTRAGSDNVASLYGWVDADRFQLAMLQQFLRTASDGWELALASVRNLFAEADLYADEVGGDFAGEAQRLGEAVRRIHGLLAEHFPTGRRTAAEQAGLGAAMTARLEEALDIVPELAAHAPALRELYDAAGALDGSEVQRVHGDLHLGQTLRTAKGWKVVDFEGEPAKPLAERVEPDSPWRDVAGMLRSFDYAPRVAAMTAATADDTGTEQRLFRAAEWSARNQTAFLEAYAGHHLTADEHTLLTAYIADKSVYECVYEARNRPGWLSIPLAALGQPSGTAAAAGTAGIGAGR
jgi:maltokinase